jgi:hypothetical protein
MAIALFPLNEGETLESNFLRYAKYMNLNSTSGLWRRLFGYQCRTSTRLPYGFSHLALQTRDSWGLEANQIIERATEFNYVAMMAAPEVRANMQTTMQRAWDPSGLKLTFPVKAGFDIGLRYCDECLSDWYRAGTAPYLKISHQLPGVYYCEIHLRLLKMGRFSRIGFDQEFEARRRRQKDNSPVLVEVRECEEEAIKGVSVRSAQQLACGNGRAKTDYVGRVRDAGYITPCGRLRTTELIRDWLAFFGPRYCRLTAIHEFGILRWWKFVSTDSITLAFPHPFIFIAAEVLFSAQGKFIAVPSPGTLLQVPTAKQPRIPKCRGSLHRTSDSVKALTRVGRSERWVAQCSCGIGYRASADAALRGESMVPYAYGNRYRAYFHSLIAKGYTRKRAAREVGVADKTVANWIRAEALEGKSKKVRLARIPRCEIEALRQKWKQLVRDAPPARRITSAYLIGREIWKKLAIHDHAWLVAFNQTHRSSNHANIRPKNNPGEEDIVRLHEIRDKQLSVEPPIWVNHICIIRAASLRNKVKKNKDWSKLLAGLAESRSEYFERVLAWVGRFSPSERPCNSTEFSTLTHLSWRVLTEQQRTRARSLFHTRG